MSKALEAAHEAGIEAFKAGYSSERSAVDALTDYRDALLAYLVEDEAAIQIVAAEIWDGLNASGLAYEAEERRAKLSAKAALMALRTLAGKE